MVYDAAEAAYQKNYYETHKKLKGRSSGKSANTPRGPTKAQSKVSSDTKTQAKVALSNRLKGKIQKLETALSEVNARLSEMRRNAKKEEKKNSDGKTDAKERQSAKEYRERNREKLKSKEKDRRESGGGSSTSSSSSKSTSEMSLEQLEGRATAIKRALRDARSQLSKVNQKVGSLTHSALIADPSFKENFPRTPISRKESVTMTADFGGYATRSNILCTDGRTILSGAFKEQDGQQVPLVWNHDQSIGTNIIGHCKLEHREDGVYAHAFFNDTETGKHMKQAVQHGDIKHLSIHATNLVEQAKRVMKGAIREVSLVVAGANKGAYIDHVNLAHGDGEFDVLSEEAEIFFPTEIDFTGADNNDLSHAETATATAEAPATEDLDVVEILETLDPKQRVAVNYLLVQAMESEDTATHSESGDDTVTTEATAEAAAEVGTETNGAEEPAADANADAATDDSTDAGATDAEANAEAGDGTDDETGATDAAAEDTTTENGDAVQHTDTQEGTSMTHNIFDRSLNGSATGGAAERTKLSKEQVREIIHSALDEEVKLSTYLKGYAKEVGIATPGSDELKHGIENIEYLFPDFKALTTTPNFISRRMDWVEGVLNGVHKTPFAKIKTIHADITMDEARAKGYVKGDLKEEEFFELMKRETGPQTIYKKQKLDRDDVIDIVDFEVIAWMKAEMKLMLDEEIASAILIGDGRSNADKDRIRPGNVRPIADDADLYTTKAYVNIDDTDSSIEELVDSMIDNRQYYKGTGLPTFYTSETVIAKFLKQKDDFGHRMYKTLDDIATALRVRAVVPVDTFTRRPDLLGIMVNLADYNVGTDRGGQATMFDDFDLDFNKLRYLLETRLSGALVLPQAAIAFFKTSASSAVVVPEKPTRVGNVVTVPTITGVVYKNAAGTTLTTASPVTLSTGSPKLDVVATPASGKHFSTTANTSWSFDYDATPPA